MAQKIASSVNDRTYQEVEYLKKSLGPILVAALAEICIRRPADPIEYLGHWLLRWRYNEELKRRDVQNAMEVVKARQWSQVKEDADAWSSANPKFEPLPEVVSSEVPNFEASKQKVQPPEELDTQTLYAPPEELIIPQAAPVESEAAPKTVNRSSNSNNTSKTSGDISAAGGEKKKSSVGGVFNDTRKASDNTSTGSPLKGNFGGSSKSQMSSKSKVDTDGTGSRKSSKKMSSSTPRKVSGSEGAPAEAARASGSNAFETLPPEVDE